jgi:hypothetical protein
MAFSDVNKAKFASQLKPTMVVHHVPQMFCNCRGCATLSITCNYNHSCAATMNQPQLRICGVNILADQSITILLKSGGQ